MNSDLLLKLETRFKANMHRHPNHHWEKVKTKLVHNKYFESILKMEETGGEPDVVDIIGNPEVIYFIDMAKETPAFRRSFCYDDQALNKRKENKPHDSAVGFASKIGASLLTIEEYKIVQGIEAIDLSTSSWLLTSDKIRNLGGAIFGDNRYGEVFIYHNSAESYYSSRGVRLKIKL